MKHISIRIIFGTAALILSVLFGFKGLLGEFCVLLYLGGILVLGGLVNKSTTRVKGQVGKLEKLLLKKEVAEIPKINVKPPIFYYLVAALCFLTAAMLYLLDQWIFMGVAITLSAILYFNAELENIRRANDFLFEYLVKEVNLQKNASE